MRNYLPFLVYLFVVMTGSCKEENVDTPRLKAIQTWPENLQLGILESQFITAEPNPVNADPQEMPFQWGSSNTGVATVSASGQVKGVSAGRVEITVSGRVSTGISKKIPVTVTDNRVPLTGIVVTPETLELEKGQSVRITASTEPVNAMEVSFSWESDNEEVATVNSTGIVTGRARGTAVVTVKSGDIKKEVPVTVTQTLRVVIGSTTYSVDTLNYEVLGEGIHWLKFGIPEFINGFGTLGKGLVVNAVEVDLTYPENKLEVWDAMINVSNSNRESPFNAFKYEEKVMDKSGRKPVALTNGDFYLLDANLPKIINNNNQKEYSGYQRRRPLGMEVTNGKIIQTPFTDAGGHRNVQALVVRDDGTPDYAERISFTGNVKTGSASFNLSEVNSFAREGELVLFNNRAFSFLDYSQPAELTLDSALAWSPYPSTMVSLSHPKGGWKVNEAMKFTVTEIEHDVETEPAASAGVRLEGGKRFNGHGAILVGNPTSPGLDNGAKKFLSSLKVGDEIEVTTEVNINGSKVNDKKLSAIGIDSRGAMLRNGAITNTWNEAHPRTAIGYSQDKKTAYLIVIDGRQSNYSVGTTTGQVAAILKALGAHTGLNLDGGGSSAMIVNGVTANQPSDNPQRVVANGLMITTKK